MTGPVIIIAGSNCSMRKINASRLLVLACFCIVVACNAPKTKDISEGEQLAKTYCASCHKFPEPELLDKNSWEQYMLPRMGVFLGIVEHDSLLKVLVNNEAEQRIVNEAGVFPSQPVLEKEEWEKIKAFYIAKAPDKPIPPIAKTIKKDLKQFKVLVPDYKLSPPSVTLVKINNDKTIYIGDANTQSFSVFSSDLKPLQLAKVKEGAVWTEEFPDQLLLTVMGSFSPTDVGTGFIMALSKDPNKPSGKIIDSLRRPVHSSYGDLDGDGLMDIVTCEFAKWTGKLAWWKNMGDGKFDKRILRPKPGALKAYVKDMNNDSKPDIVALFGQGDEGIFIYYNEGNSQFREEMAQHFPPSYGSTFFKLYDFNNDGFDDIIYTAGDNADFPPILKHYHGVYIFMNDGKNHFEQKHFYPLNGAYAAMPADYDKDGDIDIAAISFFPDYQNLPEESFVYLENDGKFNFTASSIDDPTMGRWIVMDVGDYDKDGDEDIILGSLAFEVIPANRLVDKWVQKGIPFIVLQNTAR